MCVLIFTTLKQPTNRVSGFEKNYDFLGSFEKTQIKRKGKGGGEGGEVRLAVLTFSALSALSLAICSLTLCLKKTTLKRQRQGIVSKSFGCHQFSTLGYEQTLPFG